VASSMSQAQEGTGSGMEIHERYTYRVRERAQAGSDLGFIVNSETRHRLKTCNQIWALLLTAKQDTVKTSNQILDI
jgi:hypothetical protein